MTTPLETALAQIGTDPKLRRRLIEECKVIERTLKYQKDHSIRDEVTAPIVDALHQDVGILRKVLSNGLIYEFHYRSKIAREFVMSEPVTPDHVWEPQTTKLLVYLAATSRQALVGGAYFGDQVIPIARELAGRGGVCHAFELNADQAKMLRRNAQLNRLDNIVVQEFGLWSNDETELGLSGDDSFAFPSVNQGTTYNSVSIDTYLKRQKVEQLDLIMLDIEGGELEVLRGAKEQLARPPGKAPCIVFEVHRSYVDWTNGLENTEIVKLLADNGYVIHAVRDFQANVDMHGQPIELVPLSSTYLEGPPHGFNLLATKRPEMLSDPLFKIVPGVSPKLLIHKSPELHHPTSGL
ncbi:MAG TPA: FkbM family methyltransferase [Polyangiaceae bacterium]|nr:FkbM family methyltransferase [Polyangiaceae bacterium]